MISLDAFLAVASVMVVSGATLPILLLNEPAKATAKYEVLEPETWVGKELPILRSIDIADQLRTGTWLVMLYHHDCPKCIQAIPTYERMARDMESSGGFPRIAFVAVPPYGQGPANQEGPWALGKLDDEKVWFVSTPVVIVMRSRVVVSAWEGKALERESIVKALKDL